MTTKELVLSVSRKQKYEQCPHSYYLKYHEKVWERPAAWLPQGLAVHETAEEYERRRAVPYQPMTRDEAIEHCRNSYIDHVNRMCKDTPNLDFWFWSGPYNGERDIERRLPLAEIQIVRYIEWRETHLDEEIWITPKGELALELGFEVEINGVKIRGYIDQVIQSPNGSLKIRDIKTGNKPGDEFQLQVYAEALEILYGVSINRGDFWMGKNGKPTAEIWLEESTYNDFKQTKEDIESGKFDAKPGEHCRFCPVSASCKFK